MKEKDLDQKKLAQILGISDVMVEKLLCGEIVPSSHLEKQMMEVLEIPASTVEHMSTRREKKTKAEAALEEQKRRGQKRTDAA